MPLPIPTSASTQTSDRSLASQGFWKPSSMMIRSTPSSRRSRAPAARSRPTTVGAAAARRSGSSPTASAPCVARIDEERPLGRAAIAAGEEARLQSAALGDPRQRQRGRRLAGAADDEIADADHRHRRAEAWRAGSCARPRPARRAWRPARAPAQRRCVRAATRRRAPRSRRDRRERDRPVAASLPR